MGKKASPSRKEIIYIFQIKFKSMVTSKASRFGGYFETYLAFQISRLMLYLSEQQYKFLI
jgi:hypothetical protein